MTIEVLQGTERRLYDLVAPLVLDMAVIRQNGGVAFKTSSKHQWFVVVDEDDKCVGFLPVQERTNVGVINNYYVQNRDTLLMSALLEKVLEYAQKKKFESISIITQKEDYAVVKEYGFEAEVTFINYTRFKKKI
jgi:hypothetical protein